MKINLQVSFLFLRVYARRDVTGPGSASPCIKLFLYITQGCQSSLRLEGTADVMCLSK